MAYNYSSTHYTDTPTTSAFYAYHDDAVGNVLWVTDSGGVLFHIFTQDAFGNALATGNFSGSTWSTARTAGITEHQTGKWIDPFTGLYFFSARWYDSGVGRFVGRSKQRVDDEQLYTLSENKPTILSDSTGNCPGCIVSPPADNADEEPCPSNCEYWLGQEHWLNCMIDELQKLIQNNGYGDHKVLIEFCARPLDITFTRVLSRDRVGNNCRACHGYINICGKDIVFFGDSKVKVKSEWVDNPKCIPCYVRVYDLWRIITAIRKSWKNPPSYGPSWASANPFRTNCQEWAESMVEDLGIGFCNILGLTLIHQIEVTKRTNDIDLFFTYRIVYRSGFTSL